MSQFPHVKSVESSVAKNTELCNAEGNDHRPHTRELHMVVILVVMVVVDVTAYNDGDDGS